LLKLLLVFAKIVIITLFLRKRHFFAKNKQKSQKIGNNLFFLFAPSLDSGVSPSLPPSKTAARLGYKFSNSVTSRVEAVELHESI
jgi:hypothetical protein